MQRRFIPFQSAMICQQVKSHDMWLKYACQRSCLAL